MPKIFKRNCNTCGKYYEGQGDKYCSHKCCPPWNTGLKGFLKGILKSESHKKKIGDSQRGKIISESTKLKMKKSRKEFFRLNPDATKGEKNGMCGRCGKLNPNWKGGITPLVIQIRMCSKYNEWRAQIFNRDNKTCQECEINKVWIEAHHIKRIVDIIREFNITSLEEAYNCIELWDINNGITLCEECHDEIHAYKSI